MNFLFDCSQSIKHVFDHAKVIKRRAGVEAKEEEEEIFLAAHAYFSYCET